jgi:hypothetical protein
MHISLDDERLTAHERQILQEIAEKFRRVSVLPEGYARAIAETFGECADGDLELRGKR